MLKQPSTNIKMTNVAIIRYKINNKNFQIACYRNKAVNYRNGVQNDVSQVLQTQQIFENASHGTLVKKSELNKYFANKTKIQIIQIILQRGQLQVTDKQRDAQQSTIMAQIVNIIVQKCVHPVTKRKFTVQTIKQAIRQVHFAIKIDQPAKKQALQCIKLLQTKYKIIRGDMRVKITFPKQLKQKVTQNLKQLQITNFYSQQIKDQIISRLYDIQPSKYRDLNSKCKQDKSVGLQVVVNVVINQSTKDLDSEHQSSFLQPLIKINSEQNQKQQLKKQIKQQKKTSQKKLTCSTCEQFAIFQLPADQRAHFKTQWHTQNVKRKAKKMQIISQQQFHFNLQYK